MGRKGKTMRQKKNVEEEREKKKAKQKIKTTKEQERDGKRWKRRNGEKECNQHRESNALALTVEIDGEDVVRAERLKKRHNLNRRSGSNDSAAITLGRRNRAKGRWDEMEREKTEKKKDKKRLSCSLFPPYTTVSSTRGLFIAVEHFCAFPRAVSNIQQSSIQVTMTTRSANSTLGG